MKNKLFILILLLLIIPNAKALVSCDYTDEYKAYMELSLEERKDAIQPIMCKESYVKDTLSSTYRNMNSLLKASASDKTYNGLTAGFVTPVKNQQYEGTCWAFSSVASIESNALKNGLGTYDFSELHMVYSLISGAFTDEGGKNGRYNTDTNGGTIFYGASYYFNKNKQLLESEMPYPDRVISPIHSSNYNEGRKIMTLDNFYISNLNSNNVCRTSEISLIKNKIIELGAVQATVYMDENLLVDNKYYMSTTSNSTSLNHAVTIVGWDDTISKSNFPGATKNGAWIVKNSWGDDWGDNGYYYVSYNDNFICTMIGSYEVVSTTTYDYYYSASDLIGADVVYNPRTYIASKFEKQSTGKEQIKKVSVSLPTSGTYKVYLSHSGYTNQNTWELLYEGISTQELGIKSFYTDKIVDDDYYIIVDYEATSSFTALTMCKTGTTEHLEYEPGYNFIASNSLDWQDMALRSTPCEPLVYVYTDTYEEPEADITLDDVNVTNTNNVVIDITNTSNSEFTYKVFLGEEDVTSHFTISTNDGKVTLVPDNTISGTFKFHLYSGSNDEFISFTLNEEIIPQESNISVDDEYIYIKKSPTGYFKNTDLASSINVFNTNYSIVNNGNIPVTNLYTGSRFVTTNNEYKIIIMGDSTSDGIIDSGDLLKMVKYLKGTDITREQYVAADVNRDSVMDSGDLLKVVKVLKGSASF